jgi:hypothetical protein
MATHPQTAIVSLDDFIAAAEAAIRAAMVTPPAPRLVQLGSL